jgi:hypothetical protein
MATNTQRIENLEKGMSEMQGTLGEILAALRGFSTSSAQNESVAVVHEDNSSEEDYTEPEDGKSIRVRSLFNGTLNLTYGDRRFVTFNKYGDENRVLYRDLIQIVNMNHKFAEEGYFEIEDASAVYFLGMTYAYNNIIKYKDIENICGYSDDKVKTLIENASDYQKSLVANRVAHQIVDGKNVDYNKVNLINKLCSVDISKRAESIRSLA